MSHPFVKKKNTYIRKGGKKFKNEQQLKLVSCCLAKLILCPAEGAVDHPETLQQVPVEPVWILRFLDESGAKSS